MLRIVIIFSLISLIRSENCELSESELSKLEHVFNAAELTMKQDAMNENAAICIGTARAGKSTLINHIIGNRLKGVQYSPFADFKIIKADNSQGPEIGAGPISKTKYPTKWKTKNLSGLSIFDSPGFQDNRGTSQDIANSIYLYQLVRNVESLKFVLVINFGDILNESLKPFLRLLNDMNRFFGNKFIDFFPSISVIFSKVPHELNENPVDLHYIIHILKERIDNLHETYFNTTILFINYIIDNSHRIGIFKMAKDISFNDSDINLNIFEAINNATSMKKDFLQNISPSISDDSLLCLQRSKRKLTAIEDYHKLELSLFHIFTRHISTFSFTDFKYINEIIVNKNALSNINALLTNAVIEDYNIHDSTETLNKINNTLKRNIFVSDWYKKLKLFKCFSIFPEVKLSDPSESSFKNLIIHFSKHVEMEISKILSTISEIREEKFRIKLFENIDK